MRIGVFGGSFDPPHLGHQILAELARDQLALDQMLWVPAGDPPHKQERRLSRVEHRVEMVRRCVADNSGFGVSLVDVERSGPHYSVDMLKLISQTYQGAELWFVIGGDSLRDLPTWREPAEIIRLAKLAVMSRPHTTYDVDNLDREIPGVAERTVFLQSPLIDISARDIRKRAHEGRTFRYLVSDPVCEYILRHSLYQHHED